MRRSVNNADVRAVFSRSHQYIANPASLSGDDHRAFFLPVIMPSFCACLGIEVDYDGTMAGFFGCGSQIKGDGGLASATFLGND
jgi:hypothetical protein